MTRKITEESVNAFLAGKKFFKSNTSVENWGDGQRLYLHGNLIAKRLKDSLYISSCGWNTNTTKERLNGLLHLYARKTSSGIL